MIILSALADHFVDPWARTATICIANASVPDASCGDQDQDVREKIKSMMLIFTWYSGMEMIPSAIDGSLQPEGFTEESS